MTVQPISQLLTVADLEQTGFEYIVSLIELPSACKSLEVVGTSKRVGKDTLVYRIDVRTHYEHDEDGWSPVFEVIQDFIFVDMTTTLDAVASRLRSEIVAYIDSYQPEY